MRDDCVQRLVLALRLGARGKGVLGLEPHGGDRVADLMRDAGNDAAEGRKASGLRHLAGERLCSAARVGEACAGKVDCVHDPIEVALAGRLEFRQCFGAGSERGFQLLETRGPAEQQSSEPRRRAEHKYQ